MNAKILRQFACIFCLYENLVVIQLAVVSLYRRKVLEKRKINILQETYGLFSNVSGTVMYIIYMLDGWGAFKFI